jgi:hypothetical protein
MRSLRSFQDTHVSWINAHHTKTEANHEELMATMNTNHERIEALMDVSQNKFIYLFIRYQ